MVISEMQPRKILFRWLLICLISVLTVSFTGKCPTAAMLLSMDAVQKKESVPEHAFAILFCGGVDAWIAAGMLRSSAPTVYSMGQFYAVWATVVIVWSLVALALEQAD